jgi:peptide chain release factor 2
MTLSRQLICLGGHFDPETTSIRLSELKNLSEDPNLWKDKAKASSLLKEQKRLEDALNDFAKLEQSFQDIIDLIELAEEESDAETLQEAEASLNNFQTHISKLKVECLFSGEADSNNCFVEINAGAGGTESHDWALMLYRMYMRWADKHKFKTEIIHELEGEEAGIKSVTIKINGHNAYGWCKTESGVHRLVRISPFNAAGKRQTSFASVWVYPEIDENIEIEINEKDLRIDTFRASGAGGQHINKTDSAVRITHIPTNIVVQCQSDRSQHRNRAQCYSMLKARLYELELKKREAEMNDFNASKTDNAWGHQIRSYVLQPYQLVKDLRTSYETSDTTGVLDGDLDGFMSASLEAAVQSKGEIGGK